MSGVSARYADLLADDLEAKGASVSRSGLRVKTWRDASAAKGVAEISPAS